MADNNKKSSALLLSQMSNEPDTTLVFETEKGKAELHAHATLLKLHSPVLAQALELAPSSSKSSSGVKRSNSSGSSSSSRPEKKLQMPGTSKADFLVVAQFMYPLMPLPKVSWDNLEVLLVQGHKWDMQVRRCCFHLQDWVCPEAPDSSI
jgi:hypothetical protein